MSDLNVNNPSSSSEVSDLKSLCEELQGQTQILRVVLLLVIGSLCLFFWREAGFHGHIAQQLQPQVMQASQLVDALNKQGSSMDKQLQALQGAVSRLVDYGRTHPDYVPILNKYGVPVSSPAPATAPAPATTAPAVPKK